MVPRGVEHLINLILPETDAGVLAQLVVVLIAWGAVLWYFWSRRDSRLVAIGAGVLALGLMGLRALH